MRFVKMGENCAAHTKFQISIKNDRKCGAEIFDILEKCCGPNWVEKRQLQGVPRKSGEFPGPRKVERENAPQKSGDRIYQRWKDSFRCLKMFRMGRCEP